MRGTLFVLLAFAQLTLADDFLKHLTPKDLTPDIKSKLLQKLDKVPQLHLGSSGQCAIRLKEIRAGSSRNFDPIEVPSTTKTFDNAILHPAPIPACPSN